MNVCCRIRLLSVVGTNPLITARSAADTQRCDSDRVATVEPGTRPLSALVPPTKTPAAAAAPGGTSRQRCRRRDQVTSPHELCRPSDQIRVAPHATPQPTPTTRTSLAGEPIPHGTEMGQKTLTDPDSGPGAPSAAIDRGASGILVDQEAWRSFRYGASPSSTGSSSARRPWLSISSTVSSHS